MDTLYSTFIERQGEWVLINGNLDLFAFLVLYHQEPHCNGQDEGQ